MATALPPSSPLLQPSQTLSGQPLLNSAQQLANCPDAPWVKSMYANPYVR